MVVDEEHARRSHVRRLPPSSAAATSRPRCPRPASIRTSPGPPARAMRPTIESVMPPRSSAHRVGVEAAAAVAHEDRRRAAGSTSRYTDTLAAPECRAALTIASRAASSSGSQPVDRAVAHPHDLDRHAVLGLDRRRRARSSAAPSDAVASRRRASSPPASSHARSSRSCMRASRTTSRGSSARRCTSASVCSTESCRCAATSARSSERMRSRRSADELVHEVPDAGPDDQREADQHHRGADQPARRARCHESTLTKNAASPAAMHATPAIDARQQRRAASRRAPRPRRPRRAGGGRGTASRAAPARRRAAACESSARPIIAAPSGHTITSPGHRPDRAHEQQHAEHDRARTRASRPRRTGARGRRVGPGHRHEQPRGAVEQRAEPARERQHEEAAPHDVRVDARPRRRDRRPRPRRRGRPGGGGTGGGETRERRCSRPR